MLCPYSLLIVITSLLRIIMIYLKFWEKYEVVIKYKVSRCFTQCRFSPWIFCLTRWGPVGVAGAVDPSRPEQRLRLRCGRPGAVQHHQRGGVVVSGSTDCPFLAFGAAAAGGAFRGCGSCTVDVPLFGTRQRGGGRGAVTAAVGVLARRPGKTRPAYQRVNALPAGGLRPLPRPAALVLLAAEVRPQNVVDEKVCGSVGLLGDLQRQYGWRGLARGRGDALPLAAIRTMQIPLLLHRCLSEKRGVCSLNPLPPCGSVFVSKMMTMTTRSTKT